MPVTSTSAPQILPSRTSMGANVKDAAKTLRYRAQGSDAPLWSAAADAFGTVQRQIDLILSALQSPIPQPNPIVITDASGNAIAAIGDFFDRSNNTAYEGIWGKSLWVGGNGPATAKLTASGDGSLSIANATVTLTNGSHVITLDPTGPTLAATDGTYKTQMIGAGLTVNTIAGGALPSTVVSSNGVFITNSLGGVVARLFDDDGATNAGKLTLLNSGPTASILLDPSATNSIQTVGAGSVSIAGIYKCQGNSGVTASTNYATSVSTAANGVFGTPGAGQSNATVVTGVTFTAVAFTGGIKTT